MMTSTYHAAERRLYRPVVEWLVRHVPAMRITREGMIDGRAGLVPVNRHGDMYCHYLNGWLVGDARVPDHERPVHLSRAYVRGMQSSYML